MQFFALRAKPFSALMILLVIAPAALALDWIVLDGIWWQYRASGFPVAKANITRAEIIEKRGSKGGRTYTLALDYRFTVEGQLYSGTRLRYYANGTSNRASVADLQTQFPVGSVVDAYYPPDNPSDAILMPGVQGTDWLRLLLAIAASLIVAGRWGLCSCGGHRSIRPTHRGSRRRRMAGKSSCPRLHAARSSSSHSRSRP